MTDDSHETETVPGFVATYEVRGGNYWERRVFGEGKLRQDMQHYTEYRIAAYKILDDVAVFKVVPESRIGLSEFKRASDVRESNISVA